MNKDIFLQGEEGKDYFQSVDELFVEVSFDDYSLNFGKFRPFQFKHLGNGYFSDINNVYLSFFYECYSNCLPNIIIGADSQSFELIDKKLFLAKDKKNVYANFNIIENSDSNTFEFVIEESDFKIYQDKNSKYEISKEYPYEVLHFPVMMGIL